MRQQRQRPGLALDLPYQQIDQAGLQQQPDLAGRTLDCGAEVAFAHRAQQVQAGLDETGEVGVGRQLAEPVGAQGDDQRARSAWAARAAKNDRLHGRVVAQGDRLLALVDHQDRRRTARRQPDDGIHRPRTGSDHHDMTAIALQRGRDAGPDQ